MGKKLQSRRGGKAKKMLKLQLLKLITDFAEA
jgi:hypothetical protein